MLIGVIADDFTGASDIAVTLSKGLEGEGGLHTVQYLGVPSTPAAAGVEAGVIALKSRSLTAVEAVAQSLAACRWLQAQGCEQIVFKYCSTFDSTDEGNIGPVTEALAAQLDARSVVVCPAFPAMGRTVYQGHLFVYDRPLNESGMQHHPLTPMTDADLRRVLQRQTSLKVTHLGWHKVAQGSEALREALSQQGQAERTLVVVDAISNHDLTTLGRACRGAPLVTGGSGIALALPHNFIAQGRAHGRQAGITPLGGAEAILVGSCSGATRGQIDEHQKQHPVLMIEVESVLNGTTGPQQLVEFILMHQGEAPLVYSSGDPQTVERLQKEYGRERIAAALDDLFGQTARQLVAAGVRRLVVGGGETSGAVVSALDLGALTIGREIDTGVPALVSGGSRPLALALKSGNFGARDFFARAVNSL